MPVARRKPARRNRAAPRVLASLRRAAPDAPPTGRGPWRAVAVWSGVPGAVGLAAAAHADFGGLVVRHRHLGTLFCGPEESLLRYCRDHYLKRADWTATRVAGAATQAWRRLLASANRMEKHRRLWTAWHWGQKPEILCLGAIPGIAETVYHLGTAKHLDYLAVKDEGLIEYQHDFGDPRGLRPGVWATASGLVVIWGGAMKVTARGIVN